MESRVGKLLIAHPNLPEDSWFHKSVIYIYADEQQAGTAGLALNIETTLEVRKVAHGKGVIYPHPTHRLFKGGPVNPESIIMIHTDEWTSRNTITAGPRYRMSSDRQMFEKLALLDQPAYWRMCFGISVWAPGQLDMEIEGKFPYQKENSWLLCDATDDIMFNYTGDKQWEAALEFCTRQTINSYF